MTFQPGHVPTRKTRKPTAKPAFMDAKRTAFLEQVREDKPSKAGFFQRVYNGQAGARVAIKAMCLQCCGLDQPAITECTATECPLWGYRPYQPKAGPATCKTIA